MFAPRLRRLADMSSQHYSSLGPPEASAWQMEGYESEYR